MLSNACVFLPTPLACFPRDEHQAEARERGRRESHFLNADLGPFPYDPSPVLAVPGGPGAGDGVQSVGYQWCSLNDVIKALKHLFWGESC